MKVFKKIIQSFRAFWAWIRGGFKTESAAVISPRESLLKRLRRPKANKHCGALDPIARRQRKAQADSRRAEIKGLIKFYYPDGSVGYAINEKNVLRKLGAYEPGKADPDLWRIFEPFDESNPKGIHAN